MVVARGAVGWVGCSGPMNEPVHAETLDGRPDDTNVTTKTSGRLSRRVACSSVIGAAIRVCAGKYASNVKGWRGVG